MALNRWTPWPDGQRHEYAVQLGRNLRAVRLTQRLTLAEIADVTDGLWPVSVLASWESARRAPSPVRLAEYCGFLGVPVSDVLPAAAASVRDPRARLRAIAAEIQDLAGEVGPEPRRQRRARAPRGRQEAPEVPVGGSGNANASEAAAAAPAA